MKTILFIEDEADLQKTFKEALQDDYEVVSALDGELGLRLAEERKPDLVLLDLILPKMNGFEVLEEIKKNETIKDIPIVVLTNLESVADVDKAIELGATTYLVKANYSLEEMVGKIKQILEKPNN